MAGNIALGIIITAAVLWGLGTLFVWFIGDSFKH